MRKEKFMNIFNIKSSLNIYPTTKPVQNEVIQITRGASAALVFSYKDKAYTFDDTDQITFMLKQGKTIYWYKMFTYLQPTTDIKPIVGKNYYTKVSRPANSFKCQATQVWPALTESPAELEYYEEVDGNCSWRDTEYLFDERFNFENLDGLETVSLILTPEDTLQFKTKAGNLIEFEIAVRLNTENKSGFAGQDAILIEPQSPIIVTNSLFSQI
jgi:hypothetical protein